MFNVTTSDIQEVAQFVERVAAIKFHRAKKEAFLHEVGGLSDAATRLLTFCCWFCLFNPRIKPIDPSRYFFLPLAKENTSTFSDFLSLVRHYENKKITKKREGELCSFISTCDKAHRDFYLMLLSRGITAGMPMAELQATLDLDHFSTEQLYSPADPAETGLSDMAYPVAVRTIPAGNMPLVVLAKEPAGCYFNEVSNGKLTRIKTPEGLLRDISYTETPRFALVGLLDQASGILYPVNLYDNLTNVRKYLSAGVPPGVNVANLTAFLQANLLTSVACDPVAEVADASGWGRALKSIIGSTQNAKVLVYTEALTRGREAHYVDVRLAHGVVEGLWVESNIPVGFTVWFNGVLQKCLYDFTGRENALLSSISRVQNKRISFYYMKIGKDPYLIGREIQWHIPTWRTSRLRYTDVWIEKCVFCGRTDHKHQSRGMCFSCYHALFNLFSRYEKDVWVKNTQPRARAQRDTCWEPSLLNLVEYQHQGYVLRANDKGEWGFFSDEEAMKKYNNFRDKQQ